jgi:acyl-CoA dehydrogenase
MSYRAPVADLMLLMKLAAGLTVAGDETAAADLDLGSAEPVLAAAAKVAEEELAPLNRVGDLEGAQLNPGGVATARGWPQAYERWRCGGWNGIVADPQYGGMGLSNLLNAGCFEMWNAANMAFALCPLLTMGAIELLQAHASAALKAQFLPKLISGAWTGTMNLTEPQAGSDLNGLRCRAVRHDEKSYRIFGTKIFITYGEHDMTDNIVHLVLARLPDAPPGTRGISLFLVPKFLVHADGSLGARNDVRCIGVEHKLGIHASPTCSMVYGDDGGATGYLIGEEHRGLACMFTMMNNARLGVGLQGVAIAERAYQQAVDFAKGRRQGAAPGQSAGSMSPIIQHADVRRMLMTMYAQTQAARAICYLTAAALDWARRAPTEAERRAAHARAGLLTPVAKAFATDIANEVASLGIQVHGGMGFIEETGAAQYWRDGRIAAIYEGTNGIQAIDLVLRKLPLSGGDPMRREVAQMQGTLDRLRAHNLPAFAGMASRLVEAHAALTRATDFINQAVTTSTEQALAGATPYLRLFALVRGGTALAERAMAAHSLVAAGDQDPAHSRAIASARFFADHMATAATGLATSIVEGHRSVAEDWVELVG